MITNEMTDDTPTATVADNPQNRFDQRPLKIPRIAGEETIGSGDDDGEVEEQNETETTMSQNPRLQRYLVAVEYVGTRFSGAQQQTSKFRTVVGVLQAAFSKFIGQPVYVFCSSRTDTGVHALSNVCHVDVERISKRRPDDVLPPHEPDVVRKAVNHYLQKNKDNDISVIDVRPVAPDFNSRFKAQERTYFYRLLSGPDQLSTFEKERAWHVEEDLDIRAMQRACRVLAGHHDFSSFRAASCQAKSPIRSLIELNVTEVMSAPSFPTVAEREQSWKMGEEDTSACTHHDKEKVLGGDCNYGFGRRSRHRCYVVTARARAFLYHQVRLLVGVLKCVGTGEISISDVERILEAKTVTAAKPMAPAYGLYLGGVKYDLP